MIQLKRVPENRKIKITLNSIGTKFLFEIVQQQKGLRSKMTRENKLYRRKYDIAIANCHRLNNPSTKDIDK